MSPLSQRSTFPAVSLETSLPVGSRLAAISANAAPSCSESSSLDVASATASGSTSPGGRRAADGLRLRTKPQYQRLTRNDEPLRIDHPLEAEPGACACHDSPASPAL